MIQKIMFSFVFSNRDLILINLTVIKKNFLFYFTRFKFIIIYLTYKTKHLLKTFCFLRPKRLDEWAYKITLLKKLLTKINKAPWITLQHGGYIERRRTKISFIFRKRIIKIAEYIFTKIEVRSC